MSNDNKTVTGGEAGGGKTSRVKELALRHTEQGERGVPRNTFTDRAGNTTTLADPAMLVELCTDEFCTNAGRHEKHEPIRLTVYHCPFCGLLPHVYRAGARISRMMMAQCQYIQCALYQKAFELERWNNRAPHENRVRHIDPEEPIFVLRAQDLTAPGAVRHWIMTALTAGLDVSKDKIQRAIDDEQTMIGWQRANKDLVKVPD